MSCVICGIWGCKKHVGYKGQRYEVRFKDGNGVEQVMGWTDDPTGGSFVKSVNLHPIWHDPVVIDLKDDA